MHVFKKIYRFKIFNFAFCGFGIFLVSCTSAIQPEHRKTNQAEILDRPYVVLVSIDGYRYDYTDRVSPPHLSKFRAEGTSAQALLPVYPSKTFTNHYSIATGLYAENHGIVANHFYDPIRKDEFRISNRDNVQDGSWYGGIPLWVAIENQGMLAASYFWPGSEAEIQGVRPSYFYLYNAKTPHEERIHQVKRWLELPPEKRPHFITVYFSDVDSAGHEFGPESKEVDHAVLKVDQAIGLLLSEINATGLPVNTIILSDHGMQEIDQKNVEYLDDYTNLSGIRVLGDGLQLSLYFDDLSRIEHVYQDLKKNAKHFKIFKRNQVPARYHYSKSPRCGDLVIAAVAPFHISLRARRPGKERGAHAYDPDTTPTMRGIFYAKGPQIKEQKVLKPFRNVHIYPFIMRLLGLKLMAPIDGDMKVLEPAIR